MPVLDAGIHDLKVNSAFKIVDGRAFARRSSG